MPMDRHMRVIRERKSVAQDVQEFAQALQAQESAEVPVEAVNGPETAVQESETPTPEPEEVPEPEPQKEPVPEPTPEPAKPRKTRKRKTQPEPEAENDIVDMLLS